MLANRLASGAAAQPEAGKPLRVGFIGVGGRGSSLLNNVLNTPGVEVVVICDINPSNRERAVKRVEQRSGKKPEGFGSHPYDYRKLLERDDLHCAIIATPCYWHSTMYVDAISRGMSFYGEKPLAITASGVKAVNAAYAKNPVVMQIGFQWGAHQARRDIIQKVQEGLIGDLLHGSFQRLNGWDGHGGWYAEREKSGDWMLEQAVHEFNLMWMVTQTNPVKAYTAGRSGIIPNRDTTNYYTTVLQYPEPLEKLVMHYTHTWIEMPKFSRGGLQTQFVGTDGGLDVMGAYAVMRKDGKKIEGDGKGGDTGEHFVNFFECVRNGTPEKANCGIANGTGASIIGLMIRQSLELGRVVTIDETLADTRKPPVPEA
jgi:predicted dehydrogenase